MKKLFTLVCIGLLIFQSNAQNCTTYPIVKPSWWNTLNGGSGPTSFDLGLTEDSIDITNDDQIRFTQGQDTSFEIQYLMPVQFDVSDLGVPGVSVVDVSSVTILGVSGLPTGLVWDLDLAEGVVTHVSGCAAVGCKCGAWGTGILLWSVSRISSESAAACSWLLSS